MTLIPLAPLPALGANARRTTLGILASRRMRDLPDHAHPVARFGALMSSVEAKLWRDDRRRGVAHATIGATVGLIAGRAAGTTATVSVVVAGAQLRRTAAGIGAHLRADDLEAARRDLPALVGRSTDGMSSSDVAAAVVESVAENMVDAVFAPAWWGLLAGGAGAGAHRAINTMDAMIGRRDERYERYGWAAARLDDLANLIPARLFAATVASVKPDRAMQVMAAVANDAAAHPSPNAGVAEAAMAGALGCELGGPLRYGDRAEVRPTLGTGPRPGVDDVDAAILIAERCELALIAALGVTGVGIGLATGTAWA